MPINISYTVIYVAGDSQRPIIRCYLLGPIANFDLVGTRKSKTATAGVASDTATMAAVVCAHIFGRLGVCEHKHIHE